MDLIRANDKDSGTIANSTFQGGSIEVYGGPWTITDNTVTGVDGRYLFARRIRPALSARCAARREQRHPVRSRRPRIPPCQSSPAPVSTTPSKDNSFGGGAGQIGNELTYVANAGQFGGHQSIRKSFWRKVDMAFSSRDGPARSQATAGCSFFPTCERPPFRSRRGRGWSSRSSPGSMPTERPT